MEDANGQNPCRDELQHKADERPLPANFAPLRGHRGYARRIGQEEDHIRPHRGQAVSAGGGVEVAADVIGQRRLGLFLRIRIRDIIDGVGLCPGGNQCFLRHKTCYQRAGQGPRIEASQRKRRGNRLGYRSIGGVLRRDGLLVKGMPTGNRDGHEQPNDHHRGHDDAACGV